MAQVDNVFTAFWMDTTTAPGVPLTGLLATIKIKESPGGVVAINNASMTNIGDGWYEYIFSVMDKDKNYVYTCSPGSTAYIDSGVTDKRQNYLDRNLTDIIGGGFARGGDFTAQDRKWLKDTHDTVTEIQTITGEINNEALTRTDIQEVITSQEAMEIPETDLSPVITGIGTIKTQITKLSKIVAPYIESENATKDDMQALCKEFEKQDLEMKNIEKQKHIEEAKKEAEEKRLQEEENKNTLTLIKKEFLKQEDQIKEEKKKELEEEIKELEVEMKEKEKELKTL